LTFLTGQSAAALGSYRVRANAAVVTRWRVQLARDERFRDLLVDRRVEANVNRFEARDLAAGRYFLRVRSIDAQRFESQPSAVQRFAVVDPEVIPSVPGRRAAVRLLDGLFCGLDGSALAVVTGPLELSPGRAHVVRCADNAEGTAAVEFPIAAADSGLILARGRAGDVVWTHAGGERRVALRVMDAAGAPLAGFAVTAGAEQGALDPLRASTEPGTYVTTLRWRGPSAGTTIHVQVAGAEAGTLTVPAAAPPAGMRFDYDAPLPTPVAPPANAWDDPRRVRRLSAGMGLGAIVSTGPLGPGFAAALSGRYRFHYEALDILIGIHLGYERFGCSGGMPAPGRYCAAPTGAPQEAQVTVDAFSVGVPLGIARRFGDVFVPYLSVAPELVLGRARALPLVPADGALRTGFGLRAVLGAQLDLREHAPFVEVGYRYATLDDDRLGTLDIGGLSLMAGYRVQW
jgi:hypothetical protein